MAKIITTIEADGAISVEVNGVEGKACASLTDEFERALGKTGDREKTKDWYGKARRGRVRQ